MKINNYSVLTPAAYGKNYKTQKDAEKAFRAGKDFFLNSVVHGFTYCSIRDFEPGTEVEIRFKDDFTVVKV